jgi:hypothetical protein
MRFNPPPSWPQPPEGWTPPPGWQPDVANLPPLPDGWVLWLPDDVPAGAPGPAFADPASFGAFGGQDDSAALSARRGAARTFWIGLALLVGVTLSTILASGDGGGFIWTGGFVVAAGLLIRAGTAYRAARRAGAPAYATRGWVGVAGGVVVALVAGAVAITSYASPGSVMPHVATGVGSCWVEDDGEYLEPVDCGGAHRFTAVEQVDVVETCPLEAAWYGEADDTGYLCLREDA